MNSVFIQQNYLDFAEQVQASLLDLEEPEEIQIRKTLPAIAQRLNVVRQDLAQTVNEWGEKTQQHCTKISRQLDDIVCGRVAFVVRAQQPGATTMSGRYENDISASAFSSGPDSGSGSAAAADVSLFSQPRTQESGIQNERSEETSLSYKLSRTIQTVPDLWREWTAGLGNRPAVQSLEDSYGAAWRPSQSERVMFGRRKVIIDEIRARQSEGLSVAAAVEQVELVRQRGNLSLHGLYKLLNKPGRNHHTEKRCE